jgi:hypothetical protein
MKKYEAFLESLTPYCQGRHHDAPKLEQERPEAYDKRTCLQRLHTVTGGKGQPERIYIPPTAFKKCLEETAIYLGLQIPGKGKSTYTKHFKRGVLCTEPLLLDIGPKDVRIVRIFTSLTPGKMNSPRGWRYFPVIDSWSGVLEIVVIDEMITAEVLKKHLEVGGVISGIGVWRPSSPNGGMWGKFKLGTLIEKEM